MAIGERIHFFRLLRGMTQKYLGMALGFPEKSADVRLAQYETGSRTPKADLTAALAQVLDVSPHALSVPDIDSYVGLMHTLFTLEDNYGLKISEMDGEVCLKVDVRKNKDAARLHEMLWAWREQAAKLEAAEISQEEYDEFYKTCGNDNLTLRLDGLKGRYTLRHWRIDAQSCNAYKKWLELGSPVMPDFSQREIIDECLALFGDRIVAIHAKDVQIGENGRFRPCVIGDGLFDHEYFYGKLAKVKPDISVLREEAHPETAAKDIARLKQFIARAEGV